MPFQEFPKWKFHQDGRSCIVQTLDAELVLGAGWGDSPAGPFASAQGLANTADKALQEVLTDVTTHPGTRVMDICARLKRPVEDVQGLLDQLEGDHLVEKAPFGRYHPMPAQETPSEQPPDVNDRPHRADPAQKEC
jgi:hypothetical protein